MDMEKSTVLIVEDDLALQGAIKENLEVDGYNVIAASNAEELETELKKMAVDTILLDIVLPDEDGLNLIRKIQVYSDAPIIVVSGKDSLVDKVVGLEMGADDYLPKPFEMRELSARIKANIRRYKSQANSKSEGDQQKPQKDGNIRFGCWTLDRMKLQVFNEIGNSADLTVREFRLLEALLMAPNRVLSREQLLDKARAYDYDVYDRTIDVQITRIRKKIEEDPQNPQFIKTVRGAGYMLVSEIEYE